MYKTYFLRGDMVAVMKRESGVTVVIHKNYDKYNNTCVATKEVWDVSRKEATKFIKKYLDNRR